jgi:superfamily II DNA helicase RecQ
MQPQEFQPMDGYICTSDGCTFMTLSQSSASKHKHGQKEIQKAKLQVKEGHMDKQRKNANDLELYQPGGRQGTLTLASRREVEKLENLFSKQNGQGTRDNAMQENSKEQEEEEESVERGEIEEKYWKELLSFQLIEALNWNNWLGEEAIRAQLLNCLPNFSESGKRWSMSEVLEKTIIGKAFGRWWLDGVNRIKGMTTLLQSWMIGGIAGAFGNQGPSFGSIFCFPDKDATLERRRDLLLEYSIWIWNVQNEKWDMGKEILSIPVSVPVDIAQLVQDALVPKGNLKGDVGSGRRLAIECFLAAKFLSTESRKKGAGALASSALLQRLAKDLLWILQFYHLLEKIRHDGEEGKEQQQEKNIMEPVSGLLSNSFMMELSKGENSFSFIKVTLKQIDKSLKLAEKSAVVMPRVVPSLNQEDIMVDGLSISKMRFLPTLYADLIERGMECLTELLGEKNDTGKGFIEDFWNLFSSQQRGGSFRIIDPLSEEKNRHFSLLFEFLIVSSEVKNRSQNVQREFLSVTLDFEKKYQSRVFNSLQKDTEMWASAKESWSERGLKEWLKKADLFLEIVLVLLQISGGGAARGTELELLSCCNTSKSGLGGQRNMFWIVDEDGMPALMTVLAVPKTAKTAGGIGHPVPRMMPSAVSKIVLVYMICVRSIHCYFTSLVQNDDNDAAAAACLQVFKEHFIVHQGQGVNAAFIRITFQKILFMSAQICLKMSAWRHLSHHLAVTELLEGVLAKAPLLAKLEREAILDDWSSASSAVKLLLLPVQNFLLRQAGHSLTTAEMQYGEAGKNGVSSHPLIGNQKLQGFLVASGAWHSLLIKEEEEEEEEKKKKKKWGQKTKLLVPVVNGLLLKDEYLGKTIVLSEASLLLCQGKHTCLSAEGDESCLKDMVCLFCMGKNEPEQLFDFKSIGQRKAIEQHVVGIDKKCFLVVLPTGGGKTMVMQMPLLFSLRHYNAVAGISIIVTPLIALRTSQMMQLQANRAFPQSCTMVWQDLKKNYQTQREMLSLPVSGCKACLFLFVTPEAVEETAFKVFYSQLQGVGRVERVFVDEAHNIVVAGETYRPAYKKLARNLNLLLKDSPDNNGGAGSIPFTLLSATIPERRSNFDFYKSLVNSFSANDEYSEQDLVLWERNVEEIRENVVVRSEISIGIQKLDSIAMCEKGIDFECSLFDAVISAVVYHAEKAFSILQCSCNILVYCCTKEDVNVLFERAQQFKGCFGMQAALFRGDLSAAEKVIANDWWFESSSSPSINESERIAKVLFCTTAFGEGLDHDNVNVVIHAGMTHSVTNYFQEIGRLERKGHNLFGAGLALFIVDEKTKGNDGCVQIVRENSEEVRELIVNPVQCKWIGLSEFFDGKSAIATCASIGSTIKCNSCWENDEGLQQKHWSKICFKSISDLDKIVSERQEAAKDEKNIEKEQEDLEKLSFSDLKMLEDVDAGFDYLSWKSLFFSRHNIELEGSDISTGYCFICFCKGNNCKCFNKICFKCGDGSHFRQQCQAKDYNTNGNICYKCFLPLSHSLGGGQIKLKCDEKVKHLLLVRTEKRSKEQFLEWYFGDGLSWKERLEHVKRIAEEKLKNNKRGY